MVSASFTNLAQYFQAYGVMDFLLPFILVFTIIFAVTAKLALFKDQKQFRVVIALVLALLFVVPHVTELIIVLLIFGLVVWFIVKEPTPPGGKSFLGKLGEDLGRYVEKR